MYPSFYLLESNFFFTRNWLKDILGIKEELSKKYAVENQPKFVPTGDNAVDQFSRELIQEEFAKNLVY